MRELSDDESGAETGSDNNFGGGRQAISDLKDVEKPWLKEFNAYLRDIEDLGGRTVVQWWGVSIVIFALLVNLKSINSVITPCFSLTQVTILCGRPSRWTICQLWHHRSPVKGHSHRLVSQSANDGTDLAPISLKHFSF